MVNLNRIDFIEGNYLHLGKKELKISSTYKTALINYLEESKQLPSA
ncbi:MAG: hypothetical protein OHK0053_16130 [Microscillaceae bacterium]